MSRRSASSLRPPQGHARQRRRRSNCTDPIVPPPSSACITHAADVIDRARGVLLGLAVGDALGTTLEFTPRDRRPHHTEMLGGGPFALAPGDWTDDTAMALALADSLLTARQHAGPGGFDPDDLAQRFVAWWRRGAYSCTGACFDIGITTATALRRYERTGRSYAGSTDTREAGNGSLMRVGPAALVTLTDAAAADRLARDQSRVTHAAPQAIEACAFFVQLLREAIQGEAEVLRPRPWARDAGIRTIAAGSWRGLPRHAIRSSGYVLHTLEAALWAVGTTASFEEALIRAVNLGEDADTVGAVTGQLAGAIYGASAIPERWLDALAWRERITRVADDLMGSAGTIP